MGERPVVSFCATNLNTVDRLPASIESIETIGRSIGAPFEVVVADGPSSDGARAFLEARARSNPGFRLVPHALRNRGYGRRRAFEESRGATIVPFDTSLTYDPMYADLLRAYRSLQTDRMLFSEICALSRRSIESVGGWRDLIGGEDFDLYARVVQRFGLIAYPIPVRTSQSAALSAVARQLRYVRGSRLARALRIYRVQRDQIIGSNYRVGDLMAFNSRKPWARRAAYRAFFTIAALGARLSPLRPFRFDRNNYLVFREAIFSSLLAGSEKELRWDGPPPKLLLSRDEFAYLGTCSSLFRSSEKDLRPFLGPKETAA
jgi:glycosyltransferase involved in cell wall biosynthesis